MCSSDSDCMSGGKNSDGTINNIGDVRNQLTAKALAQLGMIAALQGQHEEARRYYKEALTLFKQLKDPDGRAGRCTSLGISAGCRACRGSTTLL